VIHSYSCLISGTFAHSGIPIRRLDFMMKGEMFELELPFANEDTECDKICQNE
jgi:hypothetical protein